VQITGKWDNIGAGVEHYAANPAPACRSGQGLQPPSVPAIQGCTGFYFNAYEMSVTYRLRLERSFVPNRKPIGKSLRIGPTASHWGHNRILSSVSDGK
jgi:hypothetical protein